MGQRPFVFTWLLRVREVSEGTGGWKMPSCERWHTFVLYFYILIWQVLSVILCAMTEWNAHVTPLRRLAFDCGCDHTLLWNKAVSLPRILHTIPQFMMLQIRTAFILFSNVTSKRWRVWMAWINEINDFQHMTVFQACLRTKVWLRHFSGRNAPNLVIGITTSWWYYIRLNAYDVRFCKRTVDGFLDCHDQFDGFQKIMTPINCLRIRREITVVYTNLYPP